MPSLVVWSYKYVWYKYHYYIACCYTNCLYFSLFYSSSKVYLNGDKKTSNEFLIPHAQMQRKREKYNPDYAIVLTWTLLMTLYWYRSRYAVGC